MALVAPRSEDDTRFRGEAGKPLHLRQIAKLVGQREDTMPDAPIRKIRRAEPFEVIGAGVKPKGDAADLPDDDLSLLGADVMDRNVGLAARKAQMPVGRQQFNDDPRVIPMQPGEARSQDIVRDRLDAGRIKRAASRPVRKPA